MNRPLRKRQKTESFELREIEGVKVIASFSDSTATFIRQTLPVLELELSQAWSYVQELKSRHLEEGGICDRVRQNFPTLDKLLQQDEIGLIVIKNCEAYMKPRACAVSILSKRLRYPTNTVERYARPLKSKS